MNIRSLFALLLMTAPLMAFARGGPDGMEGDQNPATCSPNKCTVTLDFFGNATRPPQYAVKQNGKVVMYIDARDAAELARSFQHLLASGICQQ